MAKKKLTVEKARDNFYKAYEAKEKLMRKQKEDFEIALGDQWKSEDVAKLEGKGIKALTVNQIRPIINLITGLERQNRTDFRAFPEGAEDSIKAEIASRLLKNAIKQSDGEFKFSEMFEDGVVCGESALELWLDNTYNLKNGRPQWKKINFDCLFPAPNWKEYDFSDAPYVCKLTKGLEKDDLIGLFPEKEKEIDKLASGRIDLEHISSSDHRQGRDYPTETQVGTDDRDEECFDLVDYYYKKYVKRFYIVDVTSGRLVEFEDKDEAEGRVQEAAVMDPSAAERFKMIERSVPEIWVMSFTGGMQKPLQDEKSWFYPMWKGYPFINFFAHFTNAPLHSDKKHYLVQGIVRGAIDSQFEYNKRKVQQLAILNSSANGGWLTPEGAWVDPKKVEAFGATPGVNLEYKPERGKPERIFPMPRSEGHAALALESKQDIKDETGINADLLALQEGGQSSGRAIALRQRQGLVMVQKIFDNLSRSKKMAGKFLLSQLNEIYDVTSGLKVLGEAFIKKNFTRPGPPDLQTGQPTEEVDYLAAQEAIMAVLQDPDFGKYDVTVGESVFSETMRIANFSELLEMAQLPQMAQVITPDIITENSQLPQAIKSQIQSNIDQARAQAAQQAQVQTTIALREADAAANAAAVKKGGK